MPFSQEGTRKLRARADQRWWRSANARTRNLDNTEKDFPEYLFESCAQLHKEQQNLVSRRQTLPAAAGHSAGARGYSGAAGLAASLEGAFRERRAARSRAAINQILQEPGGFDRLLAQLQALSTSRIVPNASAPMVVIPIDQGEEFGADGGAEADAFLDLLAQTLAPSSPSGGRATRFHADSTRRQVGWTASSR